MGLTDNWNILWEKPDAIRTDGFRITSPFADDLILFISSGGGFQHALERFAADCEAVGMRISTSKSAAPTGGV